MLILITLLCLFIAVKMKTRLPTQSPSTFHKCLHFSTFTSNHLVQFINLWPVLSGLIDSKLSTGLAKKVASASAAVATGIEPQTSADC